MGKKQRSLPSPGKKQPGGNGSTSVYKYLTSGGTPSKKQTPKEHTERRSNRGGR